MWETSVRQRETASASPGGDRRRQEDAQKHGIMPRGRGGHASQPGSARGPGGAPERERRREEERSGGHAQIEACSQTRQSGPRIAPGSGYAGIWSRPRNAPRGHQRPPERKILPETCSRLERSAGGLEMLPRTCLERLYFVQNDNEKTKKREILMG